jgi:hypothetical protein
VEYRRQPAVLGVLQNAGCGLAVAMALKLPRFTAMLPPVPLFRHCR